MNKEIYIEGIGNILIVKSNKAKQLSIRLKPFSPIKVTIPLQVDEKHAVDFILKKKVWIKRAQLKMQSVEAQKKVYTENTHNIIPGYSLLFKPHNNNKVYITTAPQKIVVAHPINANLESKNIQEGIENAIVHTLRYESKKHLPVRTYELAQYHNFKINRVTIRNAKTRWGSCSANNNINLSLHLMRLPRHLSDYIILHELCHTVHKNHGKEFWKLLNMVCGFKSDQYKDELRKYSLKYF